MKGVTISVQTAPDDVSAAVDALRAHGVTAGTDTLMDKGLVLVVAGFAHDGPRAEPTERQAAAVRVLAVLSAAGIHGEQAGSGFARDSAFADG